MRAGWLLIALLTLLLAAPAQAVTRGWAPTGSMNVPRGFFGAALLDDGKVLVAGGDAPVAFGRTATAELYDPVTGTWTFTGSMVHARTGFPLLKLANGKVLAAGGADENGAATATAELYDPATGRWEAVENMKTARYTAGGIALADGRAFVANGSNASYLDTGEFFDPVNRSWSQISIPGPPRNHTRIAPLPGGRFMVVGGWDGNTAYANSAEYAGGWGNLRSMGRARWLFGVSPLAGGRVLVTGGGTPDAAPESTEIYDPASATWTNAAPMLTGHLRHTATSLPNGKVLVAAGMNASGASGATTELYDPASGWSPAGNLVTARNFHTATLLADGRVLVAGGFTDGPITPTAELWTPTTSLAAEQSIGFGDQAAPASAALQVVNTGDSTLFTDGFALGGANPADFAVDAGRCRTVAPGATCVIGVTFAPAAAGARSATLTFGANTAAGTQAVLLGGRGLVTADADGDGVPDAGDRCKTLKGTAARQGCPTGLLADPSIRYRPSGKGIRVLAYYVKATTGTRVVVACSRGCKKTVTKGKGAKRVRITRLSGKRLKNGTKITITVSKPGRLTTTVTDRVAKARRIEGRPTCAPVSC